MHVGNWWNVAFLILLGLVEFLLGGKSRFSYCWESVGSARFSHGLELGGRSLSRTVGSCRAENQFFHIVGIRWEGHFLILLGVVGHFSHIVGSQVRVESHFSHVVANWWKVAFLILLEVKARSGKSLFACWASSGKSPFLIIFRSGGAQRQREGGNSLPTPNNMRKVLMGIRFFLAFLILLGVEGEFPPLSLG